MTLISIRRKFGNAVTRNRARRRIREICRAHGWLDPSGRLILITVSDRAARATFQHYKTDLEAAFSALEAET